MFRYELALTFVQFCTAIITNSSPYYDRTPFNISEIEHLDWIECELDDHHCTLYISSTFMKSTYSYSSFQST